MISTRELKYVNSWARETPMPGVEYSLKVLEHAKSCYEAYNEKYRDKEYSMIFSNGDEVDFCIFPMNLCHLLGIDANNIKQDMFHGVRTDILKTNALDITSYQILESILENMEEVAEYDNDPNTKLKLVNYYKTAVKSAIFEKFSNFERFNFGAINSRSRNGISEDDNYKLLFVPSNEAVAPYFLMGLKPDSKDTGQYVVATLLAPNNPQAFFRDQDAMIPTQIITTTESNFNKIVATPEEKIALLTMYHSIVKEHDLPNRMQILGDYMAVLNDQVTGPNKPKIYTK